jgi:excisionase family DNA binding protein
MPSPPAEKLPGYISTRAAARALGTSTEVILRLIEQGQLGSFRLPGSPPKVKAADVERLRREALRPARSPAQEAAKSPAKSLS